MTKGFYLLNNDVTTFCCYVTGEKKGNKWIETEAWHNGEKRKHPEPKWQPLNWMCLPDAEEIAETTYSETNPLDIPLE